MLDSVTELRPEVMLKSAGAVVDPTGLTEEVMLSEIAGTSVICVGPTDAFLVLAASCEIPAVVFRGCTVVEECSPELKVVATVTLASLGCSAVGRSTGRSELESGASDVESGSSVLDDTPDTDAALEAEFIVGIVVERPLVAAADFVGSAVISAAGGDGVDPDGVFGEVFPCASTVVSGFCSDEERTDSVVVSGTSLTSVKPDPSLLSVGSPPDGVVILAPKSVDDVLPVGTFSAEVAGFCVCTSAVSVDDGVSTVVLNCLVVAEPPTSSGCSEPAFVGFFVELGPLRSIALDVAVGLELPGTSEDEGTTGDVVPCLVVDAVALDTRGVFGAFSLPCLSPFKFGI